MAVGNGDTDPGNVNGTNNQNLYNDNTSDQFNTEMDGFTVTLTLTIPVVSGSTNSIRIAIADVSDSSYDSNLLIAGDSLQTSVIALAYSTNVYPNGATNLDVLANDTNGGVGTLTITHLNHGRARSHNGFQPPHLFFRVAHHDSTKPRNKVLNL